MKEILTGLAVIIGSVIAIAAPTVTIYFIDYGVTEPWEVVVVVLGWTVVAAEIAAVAYVIGRVLIG